MKPLYATLAGLVGVLLAVPTAAAPCQTGQCATPTVVQTQVVTPVAAVFPLYGAGYTGAGYGGDDETKELLRELLKELQAMRQDLQGLRDAAGDPSPVRAGARVDVFEVLKHSCVSCHSGQKPRGGFSLVKDDGKFRELSRPDIRAVLNALEGKAGAPKMPPADKPQLKPAELAAVKAALTDTPAIPPGKK